MGFKRKTKTYVCALCKKDFAKEGQLIRHVRDAHPLPQNLEGPEFEDGSWAPGWEERSKNGPIILDGRADLRS